MINSLSIERESVCQTVDRRSSPHGSADSVNRECHVYSNRLPSHCDNCRLTRHRVRYTRTAHSPLQYIAITALT